MENIIPLPETAFKAKISLKHICDSQSNAGNLYEYIKLTLLDVNDWKEFGTGMYIHAALLDKTGNSVDRMAGTGDLIKILVPGWQKMTGELYDWQEIKRIEEKLIDRGECFYISIVPSIDPKTDFPESSYFMRPGGSMTFLITRQEKNVFLEIYAKDQKLSFQSMGLRKKFQHVIAGVFIAGGFYDARWTKLLTAILKTGISRIADE
jgi:hypothetical protein